MNNISSIQTGGAAYQETGNVTNPVKTTSAASVVNEKTVKNSDVVIGNDEQNAEMAKKGFAKNTVKNAIETANDSLKTNRTSARFKYHEATKQVSIKIIDDVTNEVIKEIPPEKSIEMLEKMLELSGILVDEKR